MKHYRLVPACLALIVSVLIVASCGHRHRGTEWMESVGEAEILKELVNDCGCIDVISVMLKAPQSSIERIVAGESLPTESFSMQIRQLADTYYSDGMTWKKLCKQYLPSSRFSRWYPAVCSSRFSLYCIIELIAFVIGLVVIDDGSVKTLLALCLALELVFFIGASRNFSKLIKECEYQAEEAVEISISNSTSLTEESQPLNCGKAPNSAFRVRIASPLCTEGCFSQTSCTEKPFCVHDDIRCRDNILSV